MYGWVIAQLANNGEYYLGQAGTIYEGVRTLHDVKKLTVKVGFLPSAFAVGDQQEVVIDERSISRADFLHSQILSMYWLNDFAIEVYELYPNPERK